MKRVAHVVWVAIVITISGYMNIPDVDGHLIPQVVGRQVLVDPLSDYGNVQTRTTTEKLLQITTALSGWKTSLVSKTVGSDWYVTKPDTCAAERGVCNYGLFGALCQCKCGNPSFPMLRERACWADNIEGSLTSNGFINEPAAVAVLSASLFDAGKPASHGGCARYQQFYDVVSKSCVTNQPTERFQIVDGFTIDASQFGIGGEPLPSVDSCKRGCGTNPQCKMFIFDLFTASGQAPPGSGICTMVPTIAKRTVWQTTDINSYSYLGFRKDAFSHFPRQSPNAGEVFQQIVLPQSETLAIDCQHKCYANRRCAAAAVSGNTCSLLQGTFELRAHPTHHAITRACPEPLVWTANGLCEELL